MDDRSRTDADSSSAVRFDGYGRRVFFICLLGWILTNMDQSFFGYAVPEIMAEFDIGLITIGQILSAAFVLAAVSVVLVGLLADRYGRRATFTGCLASSALLVGLQGFAPNLETLAVLRCLAFALSSGLVPITNAMVVEAAPARYRGLLSGLLQCGYPLGWFLSSMIATPIMQDYGWRYMFLPALAVVPLAFVLGRILPESRVFEQSKKAAESVPTESAATRITSLLLGDYRRRAVLGWLAFFMFGGAYAGTAFYFPTFFQQVRNYTPEDATILVGISYGIGFLGYVAAALVGEFVTTRRNTVVIWTWTGALAVLGVIWLDQGYYGNMIWFGLTAVFFYGTAAVLTTFIAEIFPTRIRATAVAVVAGVGINVGFAIYPLLVAELVEDRGWQFAFTITVVPSLFLAGVFTLFLPNLRSGTSLEDAGSIAATREGAAAKP
jgi:MFS family permease